MAIDFDGYQNLVSSSSKLERSFWIFVIFLCIICGMYWNWVTIQQYIEDPTSVSIEVVHSNEMEIPDIQLCSTRALNVTKLFEANYSTHVVSLLSYYFAFKSFYRVIHHVNLNTTEAYEHMARPLLDDTANTELELRMQAEGINFDDFMMKFGIDCNKFLLECRLGWIKFNCCELAVPVANEFYGKCYALRDLEKVGMQDMPGETNGLMLLLNTSVEGSYLRHKHHILSHIVRGASVEIAETFGHPAQVTWKISTGRANYFFLKQIQYERSTRGTIGCNDPGDDESYTTNGCMVAYRERAQSQLCKCRAFGHRYTGFNESYNHVCTPREVIECMSATTNRWHINDYFHDLVEEHCAKPLCNEWTYEVDEMKADLDQDQIRMIRNEDPETNYASVSIYYADMTYTKIKEVEQVTFDNVISQIGGNLSLFIGGSMITFVQIAVLVVQKLVKRRGFHKTSSPSESPIVEQHKRRRDKDIQNEISSTDVAGYYISEKNNPEETDKYVHFYNVM